MKEYNIGYCFVKLQITYINREFLYIDRCHKWIKMSETLKSKCFIDKYIYFMLS